jgi:filamentous hemagglutinin family protein
MSIFKIIFRVSFGFSALVIMGVWCAEVMAQIVPDDSLGKESSQLFTAKVNNQDSLVIQGGAVRRNSLFHSFSDFNVNNSERVYFANTPEINNLFVRVTGGKPSAISGLLGLLTVNYRENLKQSEVFLINPAGFIFSQGASFIGASSWVLSTNRQIDIDGQFKYDAISPNEVPQINFNTNIGLQLEKSLDGSIDSLIGNIISRESTDIATQSNENILNKSSVYPSLPDIDAPSLGQSYRQDPSDITLSLIARSVDLKNVQDIIAGNMDGRHRTMNIRAMKDINLNNVRERNFNIRSWSGDVFVSNISRPYFFDEIGDLSISTPGNIVVKNILIGNLLDIQSLEGNIVAENLSVDHRYKLPVRSSGINIRAAKDIKISSLLETTESINIISTSGKIDTSSAMINISEIYDLNGLGSINIRAYDSLILGSISAKTKPYGVSVDEVLMINKIKTWLDKDNRDGSTDQEFASARSTSITLEAPSVKLIEGAVISTSSNNFSSGGKISIIAPIQFEISGGSTGKSETPFGGMYSTTGKSETRPGYDGIYSNSGIFQLPGSISVKSGNLSIKNNGVISTQADSRVRISPELMRSMSRSDINLVADSIELTDGGKIIGSTALHANGGFITLKAKDDITLSGSKSGIFANGGLPSSELVFIERRLDFNVDFSKINPDFNTSSGNGGNIELSAKDIVVKDGASIQSSASTGKGTGGNITLSAENSILLSQKATLDSQTYSPYESGRGGNIFLNSKNINIFDSSVLVSSSGAAKAGDIFVDSTGSIFIQNQDKFTPTGLFAIAYNQGSGGRIFVNTQHQSPGIVNLFNNAAIQVSSSSIGEGGSVILKASDLNLHNSSISSETSQSKAGNIDLNVQNLFLMRDRSTISSSSGRAAASTTNPTENGGNILINARFLIAPPLENNDIKANAFNGKGGNVTINTQKTFGFTSRSRADLIRLLKSTDPNSLDPIRLQTSDITAISQNNPTLNGSVALAELNVDPAKGLDGEPLTPSTPSVSEDCSTQPQPQGSRIVNSGQGGLTPIPTDSLAPSNIWQDASATNIRAVSPPESMLPIAQGWSRKDDQTVVLTGQTTPKPTAVACHTN